MSLSYENFGRPAMLSAIYLPFSFSEATCGQVAADVKSSLHRCVFSWRPRWRSGPWPGTLVVIAPSVCACVGELVFRSFGSPKKWASSRSSLHFMKVPNSCALCSGPFNTLSPSVPWASNPRYSVRVKVEEEAGTISMAVVSLFARSCVSQRFDSVLITRQ